MTEVEGRYARHRIVGNSADNTLQLFLFNRRGGLRPAGFDSQHRMPADTAIEFHDNVFERNSLTHPSGNVASSQIPLYASMLYTTSAYPFTVDGQRDPSDGEWNLMNNTFTGNQFGTSTPPPGFGNSEVRGAVVDGGGNVCATSQTTPYPLACGR